MEYEYGWYVEPDKSMDTSLYYKKNLYYRPSPIIGQGQDTSPIIGLDKKNVSNNHERKRTHSDTDSECLDFDFFPLTFWDHIRPGMIFIHIVNFFASRNDLDTVNNKRPRLRMLMRPPRRPPIFI